MGVHYKGITRSLAYQRTWDGPPFALGLEVLGESPCTTYRYAFIDGLHDVNVGESHVFEPRVECRAAAANASTEQFDSK